MALSATHRSRRSDPWGIVLTFARLSPSTGQVIHVLLSGMPRILFSRLAWLNRTPTAVASGRINRISRSTEIERVISAIPRRIFTGRLTDWFVLHGIWQVSSCTKIYSCTHLMCVVTCITSWLRVELAAASPRLLTLRMMFVIDRRYRSLTSTPCCEAATCRPTCGIRN